MEIRSALRAWGTWCGRVGEDSAAKMVQPDQISIEDVDSAVQKLPDAAKNTLINFYTKPATIAKHAAELGVDRVRYYESLLYAEYLLEGMIRNCHKSQLS